MKPIQLIFISAFLVLGSLQLSAQTFVGVSSTPADNGTQNGPDATIVPPVGMQNGDLVVVYGHYNSGSAITLSISYSAGQTWNVTATGNSSTQSTFIAWCRYNGAWNGNPIISVPAGNTNALTATMYVYRPTSNLVSWAVDQGQTNSNSNSNPHIINQVNNTGTNTVTMAFWSNTLTNTWAGATGGTWTQAGISTQYRNNGTALQGHSAAYRIGGSGNTNNVQQSQNTPTTNTRKSIMSWRQISNDECGNAIPLFSGTSCVNTAGNVFGATLSAVTVGAPNCASGVTYDLWYSFVAQTTNPTITLSSIGSAFTNPRLQLLSGSCGGTLTSLFCGTTSINADYLTPGTTYFVRVYSTSAVPGSALNAGFNICVTDPVEPPPHNDNCSGAVNLPIWNNCNNVPGDMGGATLSATSIIGPNCATGATYDVWYRFVAVNTTATVTLSGFANNNFINRNVQVLSGNCGSFTQLACGVNTATAAGLTAGQTYYVRVYSTATPLQNGNARFNICVTTSNAPVRYGNTYVNVTKRTTGGVVEPNDILEIRMTISHTQGIKSNIRFVDNIPTNTTIATTGSGHDSVWIRTNEGLTYKRYTLAAADDAATYVASPLPGEYNIRMNLGFGGGALPGSPLNNTATESASANGIMNSSNNPRGGGGLLFAIAYRVRVTGSVGDTITLNAPQFIYRGQGGLGVDTTLSGNPYKIVISAPLTLCSNSTGINNASEFGGTFGSGTNLNRASDLTDPIDGYTFVGDVSTYTNIPDGRYAIVKNISPRSGTNRNAARRNNCFPWATTDQNSCDFRMFGGFWYIDGDHGGVSNGAAGTTPPGPSTNGSYMLLVNADFVASEIYRHTVTNLCPSTYYEFSAWVRNVCPTCGIDSTGAQFAGTATAPTSGYPGVLPNLSFLMNDVDVYNTGEIDTVGWIKKGFVFLTGPSQTSATFSIRNSAQGGGGNDWAIDDIAVATCLPGLTMRPNNTPTYCRNGSIDLSVAVSSFYNNYLYYQWERSTDGGATWHNAPEMPGTQTFTYTPFGSDFRDTVAVPTFLANASMTGYKYRIRTATVIGNLSNDNCSIYNSSDVITITVDPNCVPLNAEVLNFNIRLNNSKAQLTWDSRNEDGLLRYEVEKSTDGRNFTYTGTVTAKGSGSASYFFNDPQDITVKTYYRLKLVSNAGIRYSNILSVTNVKSAIEITNLINPFDTKISFQLLTSATEEVQVQVLDALGHQIISNKLLVNKGSNAIRLDLPVNLQRATYLLRVVSASGTINRIIQKH